MLWVMSRRAGDGDSETTGLSGNLWYQNYKNLCNYICRIIIAYAILT